MGLSENRVYSQWNSHLIGIIWSAKPLGLGVFPIFRHTQIIWAFHGLPWPSCQFSAGGQQVSSRFRSLPVPAGAMATHDLLILWRGDTSVCFFQLQKWQLGDFMSNLRTTSMTLKYRHVKMINKRGSMIYFANQTWQGNLPHVRWFSNWKTSQLTAAYHSLSTFSDCRAVLPQKRKKKGRRKLSTFWTSWPGIIKND